MSAVSDLRHLLTVEEAVDTPDGGGGFASAWQPLAENAAVFAHVEFSGGGEEHLQGQMAERVSCRITLRRRDDITPRCRLRDEGYIYDILAATMEDGGGYMRLSCLRRAAN